MNKKVIIIIAIIVVIILAACGGGIAYSLTKKQKIKPEDIWNQYISNLNDAKYEEMYDMITEKSKTQISKEDFINRNKNIYEGIEMSDMKVEIKGIEQEDDSTTKITYTSTMNTEAGEVTISNVVRLLEDKEKGYLINWSSGLIFPQLTRNDKVKIKTLSATRGSITDKNGKVLAEDGKVSSIGIVPGKFGENKEEEIQKISEILGVSVDSINNSLSASWVKNDSFVPIKKVSADSTELKQQVLNASKAIKITSTDSRVYPYGEITAQLIGYVQNINAEELKANQGKGYTKNSIIGKAGLEKEYEDRLRGQNGVEIYIEDESGNRKAEIAKIDVQNGETIKLTIDMTIQTKLYNEIKENEGLFVVMHPHTGALLALVSTPSYNPNDFVLGMSTDQWNSIKDNEGKPMMARYLQSWCPGSTFKPVTGAVGLNSKSLKEDDTFTYSGLSWKKDNSWGNYEVTTLTAYNGDKNLRNAIIHSDNIYFAQATLQIGKENFINGLKKMKFGENIEFPLTVSKSQYSNGDDISSETQLADSGYGQGQILVNPIHMASIYSAFANDGNMLKPYIEQKENNTVEYLVENAISKEVANTIKEDLIQVVENPEGTAKDMKVAGRTIAGKTGTAELKGAKGEDGETIGWFDCFTADENSNQLLIVGMVENSRSLGGSHYIIKKIKSLF